MSVQEMLQEARKLSAEERRELVKALVDMLAEAPRRRRSLREFRGVGAHLYDGADAQAYLNHIRAEWDDRP